MRKILGFSHAVWLASASASLAAPLPNATPPGYSVISRPPSVGHQRAVSGIQQLLAEGAQFAVRELGHEGGFLTNLQVRIPLPAQLHAVENTLRLLKQDQLADELVATMNHAAEEAVPQAAPVLQDVISRMSFADAEAIVAGPPDAATQYFRRVAETNLFERFLPVVSRATQQTGVTSSYKRIEHAAAGNKYLGPLLSAIGEKRALDLDSYITQKALDGLFKEIAIQEKRIRQDPVARSTEILREVFGGRSVR